MKKEIPTDFTHKEKEKSLSSKETLVMGEGTRVYLKVEDVREAVMDVEGYIENPFPDNILSITEYRRWILDKIKKRFGKKLT